MLKLVFSLKVICNHNVPSALETVSFSDGAHTANHPALPICLSPWDPAVQNGPLDGCLIDHEIVKIGFSLAEPESDVFVVDAPRDTNCGCPWLMLDL